MAALRLSLLVPVLARTAETPNPVVRSSIAAVRIRAFHVSSQHRLPDAINQRYGTANEPLPHLSNNSTKSASKRRADRRAALKNGEKVKGGDEVAANTEATDKAGESAAKVEASGDVGAESNASEKTPSSGKLEDAQAQLSLGAGPGEKPVESLLDQVPDPGQSVKEQEKAEAMPADKQANDHPDESAPSTKAPHIVTPRYVHHFDTYGLVRHLEDSGWSNPRSVTIMKAVRLMLAENMDLARDALVSKSQVENETYLFRAACAELKTEVTARRKSEHEKMRTERTQLQHELDILSQRLGQESAAMKDELKGLFDDRKMAVRNEQRGMESKIQRLNYQITVDLQADAKSEVEGLRWIMTRRTIIALGVVVIMVLGSLKLYSNTVHEQETKAKQRANSRSSGSQTDGDFGPGEGSGRDPQVPGGGELLVKEGDNPAFVSLG